MVVKKKKSLSDSPQLNCDQKWFSKLNAKNFKIKCTGKMNPPHTIFTWSYGPKANRTILEDGDNSDGLSARMIVIRFFLTKKACI